MFRALTGLFLAAALTAPAAADLGYEQAPQHAARYEAKYQSFPARGKDVRAEVREVLDRTFEEMGAPKWATGWYQREAKPPVLWVVIRGQKEMVLTFCHEGGHHFYYTALTDSERADWGAFWEANWRAMPTEYARSGPAEGFADCWMVFFGYAPRRQYLRLVGPKRSRLNRRVEAKLVSYF